jgi:hypothetical protein
VRVFLDRRRNVAPLLAAPAAALGMLASRPWDVLQAGDPLRFAVVATLTFGLLLAGPAFVLTRFRRLLQLGYTSEDVAAGIRQLQERRREEFLYEYTNTVTRTESLLRATGFVGLIVFGASGLVRLIGSGPLVEASNVGLMLGLYAGILGTTLSNRWRRLREGSVPFWSKFWGGPAGRFLQRIASVKLGRRALPPDRPTELGIAMNAESLFAELPKDVRKSVGDVPAVLHSLEAHARAMRARMAAIDASIGEARATPDRAPEAQRALVTDLERARTEAERRLADVVTALETTRLNLLRLRAGAGGIESVTQDLAAAQALGEDVERLLAGHREIETALKRQVGQ